MSERRDTPRHDEREDAYVAAARVAAEREEAADAISGQLAERSPALTIITVRREHAIHAEAALRSTLSETALSQGYGPDATVQARPEAPARTGGGSPQRDDKPQPSVPNPCSVCGVPIFGSVVGTGDGSMKDGGSFAHPECYWRDRAERLERELASVSEQFGRLLVADEPTATQSAELPRSAVFNAYVEFFEAWRALNALPWFKDGRNNAEREAASNRLDDAYTGIVAATDGRVIPSVVQSTRTNT